MLKIVINKLRKISQSKFVRNVAIVATGTAGAQAITMAFAPIITRIYGPEAFGVLGTFMAILTIMLPISALTYPMAIVLPKSDAEAKKIAKLTAILTLIIATTTTIALLISGDWIARTLSLESISSFLLLIPITMLLSGYQQIFTQWLIRKKQFKITARATVIQALFINSTKTGVGWFYPISTALIIIAVISYAFHTILLWIGTRNIEIAHPADSPNTKSFFELAKRHKDFPFYRAPQLALSALSQSLPILLLTGFFGPVTAGLYTLGKTVLGIPSALISGAVGDVFYPRIVTAANNNEKLFDLVLKATIALTTIGFLPFFTVIISGPSLFTLFFGIEWQEAGEYARWIALWMYCIFISGPSNKTIPVLKIQRFYLFFTLLTILISLAMLAAGYIIFASDIVAIGLFCISNAILNISIIILVLRSCQKFDNKAINYKSASLEV